MSYNKKTTLISYLQAWKLNMRAWKICWKCCPGYFISQTLALLANRILPLASIYFSARIIGELAGSRNPQKLLQWVLLELSSAAILKLLENIFQSWGKYEDMAAHLEANTRTFMNKMQQLDFADVDRQEVQDLYTQIQQNENWFGYGLMHAVTLYPPLIRGVFQSIGGLALSISLFTAKVPESSNLAYLNSPLWILVFLVILLSMTIAASFCNNQNARFWKNLSEDSRFSNRLFEAFGYLSTSRYRSADLRLYRQQENIGDIYVSRYDTFDIHSDFNRYLKGSVGMLSALSESISVLLSSAVYLYVGLKAMAGAFDIGYVTQYISATLQLFWGVYSLFCLRGTFRNNGEFLKTTFAFLDLPNHMYEGSLSTEKRSDCKYDIEFRDVSFRYPGSKFWALRHVNIKFQAGNRFAIVGMNGSGKTTFIKLLCRLYDPTEGQILLNGIDIRKYRYEDYIHIFSVVFQDFKLLARPLGENVAGSLHYDRERAGRCLKSAGFGERLDSLEEGLDTYLYKEWNPKGVDISGGEAQKIAIARALYKDAPFVILDEPTAALDPIAEAEIYSKFNKIVEDKTAIYISHRLSSCKFCDEIVVFDQGQIVQQGRHEILAAQEGKYAQLWQAQAQYYTE